MRTALTPAGLGDATGIGPARAAGIASRARRHLATAAAGLPATVRRSGLVLVACFLGARFGLGMAFADTHISPVWPASGLAVGAIWVWGYRMSPAVGMGILIAHLTTGLSPLVAVPTAAGSVAGYALGAHLMRRAGLRPGLDRVHDVVALIALGAGIGPIAAAFISVIALALAGSISPADMVLFGGYGWLGQGMGILTFTPLVILASRGRLHPIALRRALEAAVIAAVLGVATGSVFLVGREGLPFLVFPIAIWVALRFDQWGAALATTAVSLTAVWGTVHGSGPFAVGDLSHQLANLQLYIGSFGVTAMVLAAAVSARRRADLMVAAQTAEIEAKDRAHAHQSARVAVTRALTDSPGWNEAGPRVFQALFDTLGWEAGSYWSVDPAAGTLTRTGSWHRPEGDRPPDPAGDALAAIGAGGIAGRAWKGGRPILVDGLEGAASGPGEPGARAAAAFPAIAGGETVGVAVLVSHRARAMGPGLEDALADIGRQVGSFIERKQRTRELERSNRDLEQLAFVASHDLQEPLRMVASYVQLLRRRYEGRLDSAADEYIGFAVEGSTRMQALISDLLALSRVGRGPRGPVDVDAGRCVDEVLEQLRPTIAESGARVTRGPLPVVRGDRAELRRLFEDLIGNALKFRGPAPPVIAISATPAEGSWRFAVGDNGIGIDPRHGERVFDVFQRLHAREHFPGTGIGLAICRKVVERHGGRIWVEPNPGGGSRFVFTLPMIDAAVGCERVVASSPAAR